MIYTELKQLFRELKRTSPGDDLTAHIIFTEDSFNKSYSLLSRTYCVSSDNKGFYPHMFSNSIYAYCLDVTSDQGVRLDWYMEDEGNKGGWKVENCYILEQMQDAEAIPELVRVKSSGTVYSFGTTFIQAQEPIRDGKIHLEPLSGNQIVGGQWTELLIDRVFGYCTLLERYLNRRGEV